MLEARRNDTSIFPNFGSMPIGVVEIKRAAVLLVWFVFAVLFGFGAEAVLSGESYAALRPADEAVVAESASFGEGFTEETSKVPQILEFSGFQDVVFGLGIPVEPPSQMTEDRQPEINAVVEYINRSCADPARPSSSLMCIA